MLVPLLFLLYVNDLPLCLDNSSMVPFADDISLSISNKNISILYRSQTYVYNYYMTGLNIKIITNVNKSIYLLLTNKKQPSDSNQIVLGDEILKREVCTKF